MMNAARLKGKVKNKCGGDSKSAESIMRLYFMERLLERISSSDYKEKFILKGGLLASSLIGVDLRTTMDIDTSVRAIQLNENEIKTLVKGICEIEVDDQVTFEIISSEIIMDEFDYPGVRLHLMGHLDNIRQAVKIDVSTDDVITPSAIEYEYKLLFEERTIKLLTYNPETLLAEKLQTIIQRGRANTRLRDYYDVHELSLKVDYSNDTLSDAFAATCNKRNTIFTSDYIDMIINDIENDEGLLILWDRYKTKNKYVGNTEWKDVIKSLKDVCNTIEVNGDGSN